MGVWLTMFWTVSNRCTLVWCPRCRGLIGMREDLHEYLFGDPKRVAKARVQAKGRIAARNLRWVFVLSWAVPMVTWLDGQLQDVSDSRQDCDDDDSC